MAIADALHAQHEARLLEEARDVAAETGIDQGNALEWLRAMEIR